jgi:hypothetical protein
VVIHPQQSHPQGRAICPGLEQGLRHPTPPERILKAEDAIRVLRCEMDRTISAGFLRCVMRIKDGHPEFGPLPVDSDPGQSVSNSLGAQLPHRDLNLETDLS